ncbi:hypothetical protein [Lacticaseibacillus hegangensis]|uniref:DUF1642 domain-containing protein n=1 Tax=Lacticaseibacillus hegangensis TaxID=2486010 RepID=A0ABW4CWY2_9LACO|nr:hypothetical protein [Lacticaseibacillus hegangensis]
MTVHKYYKRGLVTAEQFDGTNVMADKYGLGSNWKHPQSSMWWAINTLEGQLTVQPGDWIATGVNGEHWPIADDIFKKTYAELPVIPQAVAYVIEWFQQNDETIGEIWRNLYEDVDDDWKEVPNLREPEEWMLDHQDTFTMAWSLGEWEVAE